jgi:hypothetical protein
LIRVILFAGMISWSLIGADVPSGEPAAAMTRVVATRSSDSRNFASLRSGQRRGANATDRSVFLLLPAETKLYSQVIWATACYTFTGPVCPMTVLLPPGSPCICYLPNVPLLPGIAR